MRNIFKKPLGATILLGVILFSSCKKDTFLNVNEDPNNVTDKTVTPYLIFPSAVNQVGTRQFGNLDFLQQWMGYEAQSGNFVPDQTITTYNTSYSYNNNLWANDYGALFDLHQTKVKAYAVGDSGIASAAMIMSVQIFQNLVDAFGDVPYSQAFDNVKYPAPAYDKAQNIYISLQKQLDSAINYMSSASARGIPASNLFTGVDIVKKGDSTLPGDFGKWIKYANTIKLRMLIRQSEVAGFNPTTEIAKIIAHGGVLHAGETISSNPGYTNSVNKQSPFYGSYGYDVKGADANTSARANSYFVDLLSNNGDDRVSSFYSPIGTSVVGCVLGGPVFSPNDPNSNPDGTHSSKFGDGLIYDPGQDQWMITSFESMFLEAEAIARGWMPGDAKKAYEAAVTESFEWLHVGGSISKAKASASNYLATSAIAQYDAPPAYFSSKAQFIAYQKYMALCGTDPMEAWSDLRRLNMIPDKGYISINPAKVSNSLPVRLLYPQTEYTANAKSVPLEVLSDAFSKKLFWQP
ncbi:SusD/RagB family nutrient-binding outer membrane lipoprotein [Parasediminibacterium sp. JCM 36343]|uniref:SusD/RagB family nutrient-binding outer membrane lipoprotein n=1 Tax=Parasediminibacterium sp. JCM 36343 TaxID=3374279 RepID=UPI00397BAF82